MLEPAQEAGVKHGAGTGAAMGDAGRRRRPAPGAGPLVTACVMSVFDVSEEDIARGSRGPARVALARQVAMYLHHVILTRTLTDIAAGFGRDRTTVAHACRLVEDRRDEPEFDAMISELESALHAGLALIRGTRRVA